MSELLHHNPGRRDIRAPLAPVQARASRFRSGCWTQAVLGGLLLAGALVISSTASAWDHGPRVGVGLWLHAGPGWGGWVGAPVVGWYDPPPRPYWRPRPHWRHRHEWRDRPYWRDHPRWRDRDGYYYRDRPRHRRW